MLSRELEDLKVIVVNCFDQLNKSLGRQIEIIKSTTKLQAIGQESATKTLKREESGLSLLKAP